MDRFGIINILKLNMYDTINLMFGVKNNTITEEIWTKFQMVQHNYVTRQMKNNLKNLKSKFAIPSRGTCLWNKHTETFFKIITSTLLFKAKLKVIRVFRKVTNYFQYYR